MEAKKSKANLQDPTKVNKMEKSKLKDPSPCNIALNRCFYLIISSRQTFYLLYLKHELIVNMSSSNNFETQP